VRVRAARVAGQYTRIRIDLITLDFASAKRLIPNGRSSAGSNLIEYPVVLKLRNISVVRLVVGIGGHCDTRRMGVARVGGHAFWLMPLLQSSARERKHDRKKKKKKKNE